MQKQISQNALTRNAGWKKLAGAAVVGAFAVVPFFGAATTAEAQPPTWGYGERDGRYNDGRDRDRDHYDRRDRDDRTLEGIVTNDRAGREFVLRLDNGQRIRVRSDEREPRRLSEGDRVRVRGEFDRTSDRNRSNGRYNDGRYNDGRHNNGRYNDNVIFRADDVQIIRNRSGNDHRYGNGYGNGYGGGYYGGGNGSQINFSGTVLEASERNRTLRVRGDNGREYNLRVEDRDDLDNLRRGERVRVRGQVRNGVIVAQDVDEI